MENGAFAFLEQMLHFPYYFQIHDISKALLLSNNKSKKEVKDQESIHPSTTPDPGYQWECNKLTSLAEND